MLTALHRLLPRLPRDAHFLDHLLPLATRRLQGEFAYWVDGGSGVGVTSASYSDIQKAELVDANTPRAIYCYEPLPENYAAMERNLKGREYVLRCVALSNEPGEAQFVVPYRVTEAGGAGAWSEGTSWGGSLKLKRRDRETVTVSKVRLIDEPIPRFDFVKLDLQGGERDAILGMGDRLSEAKLLCVEIQLAWGPDNPVELLLEHGFICFYDRLQFGFRPGTMSVPLDVLEECGLVIDRMRLPQGSMPLVCWGYFEREGAIDPTTYVIRVELAERLRESGMDYIQTDTLAINARHWSSFAQLISA